MKKNNDSILANANVKCISVKCISDLNSYFIEYKKGEFFLVPLRVHQRKNESGYFDLFYNGRVEYREKESRIKEVLEIEKLPRKKLSKKILSDDYCSENCLSEINGIKFRLVFLNNGEMQIQLYSLNSEVYHDHKKMDIRLKEYILLNEEIKKMSIKNYPEIVEKIKRYFGYEGGGTETRNISLGNFYKIAKDYANDIIRNGDIETLRKAKISDSCYIVWKLAEKMYDKGNKNFFVLVCLKNSKLFLSPEKKNEIFRRWNEFFTKKKIPPAALWHAGIKGFAARAGCYPVIDLNLIPTKYKCWYVSADGSRQEKAVIATDVINSSGVTVVLDNWLKSIGTSARSWKDSDFEFFLG